MPVKVKTDLEFGQPMFIKVDPAQIEHQLVRVIIEPSNQVKFGLSHLGDTIELYDFECSTERDELKYIEWKNNNDSE